MNIVCMLISRDCVRFVATAISLVLLSAPGVLADARLPAIFGDHMVLQQNQKDRVWGWADPDEEVTVSIERQSRTAGGGLSQQFRLRDPCIACTGGAHPPRVLRIPRPACPGFRT